MFKKTIIKDISKLFFFSNKYWYFKIKMQIIYFFIAFNQFIILFFFVAFSFNNAYAWVKLDARVFIYIVYANLALLLFHIYATCNSYLCFVIINTFRYLNLQRNVSKIKKNYTDLKKKKILFQINVYFFFLNYYL